MNEEILKELIEFCVNWRKEHKISVEYVAYACNVTGQTVRNFETMSSISPKVMLFYSSRLHMNSEFNSLLNLLFTV